MWGPAVVGHRPATRECGSHGGRPGTSGADRCRGTEGRGELGVGHHTWDISRSVPIAWGPQGVEWGHPSLYPVPRPAPTPCSVSRTTLSSPAASTQRSTDTARPDRLGGRCVPGGDACSHAGVAPKALGTETIHRGEHGRIYCLLLLYAPYESPCMAWDQPDGHHPGGQPRRRASATSLSSWCLEN